MFGNRADDEELISSKVNYAAVGSSLRPQLAKNPPKGFSGWSMKQQLGAGENRFSLTIRLLQAYYQYTANGYRVKTLDDQLTVILTKRLFGILPLRLAVRRVVDIDSPEEFGYALGTLPGHLLESEMAFIVYQRGDEVWLKLRGFGRVARGWPLIFWPFVKLISFRMRKTMLRTIASGTSADLDAL
ncbi:MAG: DUF1990 family protein [Microbacteriaceae bacterium]|nr:DUF1990 family protein [Microbacteriaceae bacterium]